MMGNASKAPQADKAEIHRTFSLLHKPGKVFEIRGFDGSFKWPESGYFNDFEKATRDAMELVRRGAGGVYTTLNPVDPALLARANNRIIVGRTGKSTANEDILNLNWLPIDLDPKRHSGISSTDNEHQAALDKAEQIAPWLERCGFPLGIIADSGNGAHLLYRVELPANDSQLLSRFLKTLDALFSDRQVKVDISTFNAARIWKVYGTLARKGDHLAERPYRLARLLRVPDELKCVPRKTLEAIAEFADSLTNRSTRSADPGAFNVRAKLKECGLEVLREEPYQTGMRLILRQCPFREHHIEGKAAVLIDADGAHEFHCFSDDCAKLSWKDLREKFEPRSSAKQPQENAHSDEPDTRAAFDGARLNLNGTSPAMPLSAQEPAPHDRPQAFPEICIRGTCAEYVNTLEPRGEWPRPFLFEEWRMIHSMLIARALWFGHGKPRFPHCHDLLIGESGITHKNTSIDRAVDVIQIARPKVLFFNNISSIEGVLEQMEDKGQSIALLAAGEYSYTVATAKRQGTSNIIPILNDAYDGKDPLTITKKKAPIIDHPFVNLVAGCTNDWVTNYADKEGADLGRFNRFTVFFTEQNRDIAHPENLTFPEQQAFARKFGEKLDPLVTAGGPMEFAFEARQRFDQWFLTQRRHLRALPQHLRKLFERDDDQVRTQAMIYAVADGRRVIEVDDTEAAIALVEWNRTNKLQLFSEVEFTLDQRIEERMKLFIARGGGTRKELYTYLGGISNAEVVTRKLKALNQLGICGLSRPLDQPSREPLRISPLDQERKDSEYGTDTKRKDSE